MVLLNYLIKIGCKIIYAFLKLKKVKDNKIVFISRLDSKKSLDFSLLEDEIKRKNKNIECVFLCMRVTSFTADFFGNIKYTYKCLSNLADARVCITDSFVPAISLVKHKKKLKIIQIWHSMGAIKKFALQSVGNTSGRDEKTAKIMNMHKGYDYIISGSKEMTKYFALAFGYPEEYFLNYGLPRMDYLLNNEEKLKNKILKDYKILSKKKNILYAPTFRTTYDDKTSELINNIDFNKFNLIVKAHERQKNLDINNQVLTCDKYSALDLITVSDYIITDYSGIAIEAAILNKKTLYYVFDYEEYKKNNGLNIDLYKEMNGCVFKDAKELCEFLNIDKYDMNKLLAYKNKYIDVQDGTSTKKIVDLVFKCMEVKDEKEN